MAEQRKGKRRAVSDILRSPSIPEPTTKPFSYKGRDVTPGYVLALWRRAMDSKQESRRRILAVRAMRRMEESSLIRLPAAWVRAHPEAASWVRAVLHERVTLEREQVARVGTVEPEFKVEALGFLESDDKNKEQAEAYFREWARSPFGIPTQPMFGKGIEDGEGAYVVVPSADDLDGAPDFYEMCDEMAYERLDEDERASWKRDTIDRRGRYVKVDKDGSKQRAREFVAEPEPDEDKQLSSQERKRKADARDQKSKDRHAEAVQLYLLDKAASHVRLIPALDCAPGFVRGTGRDRWQLDYLVTRELFSVEELLEQKLGWRGMGDRKVLPMAYNADGSTMRVGKADVGEGGQFYLYTAYLLCPDEDGHQRPMIFYTVGGSSTNTDGLEPDDPQSVGVIDLYDRYARDDGRCPSLDGVRLWGYFGGHHTEDDDPDWYYQPYLWGLKPLIDRIEGLLTAINAAAAQNAFTGHFSKPDAALAQVDGVAESFIEDDGTLKRTRIPRPGEIERTTDDVFPVPQAQVGLDAYKMLEHSILQLQQATSVDELRGDSGNAMLVGETLAKNAKRHVRDGVLGAFTHIGELHKHILHAIYECHGIKWPIQTVDERPVGRLGVRQQGATIVEYDPVWIGKRNWAMQARYPEEANLAMMDLRRSFYKDGVGTWEALQDAMGNADSESEWIKIAKDRFRNSPEYQTALNLEIAQARGDKKMVAIIKALQSQGELTQQGVPGQPNGVPAAALNRGGGQPSGGGGGNTANIAQKSRAGTMGGQQQAAAAQADAQAALTQGA
jgi:hypothetical protein